MLRGATRAHKPRGDNLVCVIEPIKIFFVRVVLQARIARAGQALLCLAIDSSVRASAI
jgi:hypothetical protein